MHIPVPGRGYWNKIQSGQVLKKLPLPVFDACPHVRMLFKPPMVVEEIKRLAPEAFSLEEQLTKQESMPEMKIIFEPNIKLTNEYVQNTEKKLNESKKKISKVYGYGRCNSRNDEAFEVTIGPDNIPRALAILQMLCIALDKRGFLVGPKPKAANGTPQYQYGYSQKETSPIYAFVLDTYISFKIIETSNKREIDKKNRKDPYGTYEYVPSGKLCFEILNDPYGHHARKKWQDGKKIRVEDQLNDIITNMIKVATIEKEKAAQAKVQSELRRIEEEKRRELEKLKKIDEARSQSLHKDVERLIKFNQIKDYIDIIVITGKQRLGDAYPDSDFSKWADWAERYLEKNSPDTWELPKFGLN